MSEGTTQEEPVQIKKPKTKADKQAEHIYRIKRTLIASLLGILAGILSYYLGGAKDALGLQNDGFLGFMLMLACVVLRNISSSSLRSTPPALVQRTGSTRAS